MAKKQSPLESELEELAKPLTFRYHDGKRIRIGDASALFRKVTYYNDAPLTDWEFWQQLEERAEPSTTEAIKGIATIFGIHRFDDTNGEGLTDEAVLSVFLRFIDEILDQKKILDGGLKLPQRYLLQVKARLTASTPAESGSPSCSTGQTSNAGDSSTLRNSPPPSSADRSRGNGSTQFTDQKKRRRSTTTAHVGK